MTFSADLPLNPSVPDPERPGRATAEPREVSRARTIAYVQAAVTALAAAAGLAIAFVGPRNHDPVGDGLTVLLGFAAAAIGAVVTVLILVSARLLDQHHPGSRNTLMVVESVIVAYGAMSLVFGLLFAVSSPSALLYTAPYLVFDGLALSVLVLLNRPQARQWCSPIR